MTDLFLIKWLAAFSPIAVVLVLMIGFGWSGGRAGAAGWFTALSSAFLFFGANRNMIAFSQAKGVLLSLNVLYIIWSALLLYNIVRETGAIETIGNGIQRLTSDKTMQLLLFGWVFSSFLQGVAGYGVPIAVVAPLLAAMGFSPIVAVVVPAIGHSWSVTFGSMGASFQAMMAVTGLNASYLAHWSALFLGITAYMCGLASIFVYGGWAMIRHSAAAIFIIGTMMAATQYLLAVSGMWTLGGLGASLSGIIACLLVSRLRLYNGKSLWQGQDGYLQATSCSIGLGWALSAYIILIVIVFTGVVCDPVRQLLNRIELTLPFPEVISSSGWVVKAEFGKKLSVFGHGGALLGYSAAITYILYYSKGYYSPGALKRIWQATIKSGIATSIGIVTMVGFALIMDQCGMTYLLAEGVSRLFGKIYPLFSPWIGLLGAFMTGSNTNSNVVFGVLQQQTAILAGLSVPVILAAQTTGGAIGSMVAPAKILVGCSTVGLSGNEGPVLGKTIVSGLIITASIGVIALFFVIIS